MDSFFVDDGWHFGHYIIADAFQSAVIGTICSCVFSVPIAFTISVLGSFVHWVISAIRFSNFATCTGRAM